MICSVKCHSRNSQRLLYFVDVLKLFECPAFVIQFVALFYLRQNWSSLGEPSYECISCNLFDVYHASIVIRLYTVSQKNVPLCDCPCLRQILTDFQNFFTGTFCGQVAVVLLLNIPPHLNCVFTLPCETLIVKSV